MMVMQRGRRALGLPTTGTDRHVSHGSSVGPVSLTVLAEMTRLVHVVIVIVAKLGFFAITSGTWKYLIRLLQCLFL